MSTTFLNHTANFRQNQVSNAFAFYHSHSQNKAQQSSFIKRIDQELLKLGIFCFLLPIMFTAAAFVREALLIDDVVEFKYYILAAFIAARIAMVYCMKGIAKQKNRNASRWMLLAAILPNLSLIAISLAGKATDSIATLNQEVFNPENNVLKVAAKSATIKKETAREIYMFPKAKAC